jgi:hypothetical protein
MFLYHVSFDDWFGENELAEGTKTFFPRVPRTCANDEDQETPRICLAPSVELCVQAMASGSRDLRKGAKIAVYSVEIDDNDPYLRHPREIVDKVPDAIENREHWYLAPIVMSAQISVVEDFVAFNDFAWSIITVQDVLNAIKDGIPDQKTKEVYLAVAESSASSASAYEAVIRCSNRRREYHIEGCVDDELSMLKWGRILRVQNLRLS